MPKIKNVFKWVNWVENEIYPWGWSPWSNTLLYYSFNDQTLNDKSWNGNNWSWYSWAWSYVQWIKWYWVQNGNRWIRMPISMPSWDFTFVISIYLQNSSSPSLQTILWSYEWDSTKMHFHWVNWITLAINSTNYSTWAYMDTNAWNNIILTRSWNIRTIYKNWTQIYQNTISATLSGWTYMIWCWYTDDRHINWILDEVILENKAWSTEEVSKYVSQLWL